MIALLAKMKAAQGKETEFEQAMAGLIAAVAADEPGNKLYTLARAEDGSYVMIELYEDEAALAAHGQSDGFKAAAAKLGGLMGGRPEVQRLTVVA